MRCGISTACFFPQDTAQSLELLAENGVPLTEVFLNTFSEIEPFYIENLYSIATTGGISIVSVHPCSSMLDGFFFASPYAARLGDGLDLYRRYFEACARLGANKLVFHGDHAYNESRFPLEQYAENCLRLAELGRKYDVALCHENVAYCRLGRPEKVEQLRPLLGSDAAFVLDLKQVRRAGVAWQEMLHAMQPGLCHVHISDALPQQDCLPPGKGNFDFPGFVEELKTLGYAADLVIELYRENFGSPADLLEAARHVSALL